MLPFWARVLWPTGRGSRTSGLLNWSMTEECSLDTGERHGWKPHTIRPAILLPFALLCLAFAVLLEVLAQKSLSQGALAVFDDVDSMPAHVRFAQAYLSTIIAIVFGLAWSWIDLDVKRIEPWLQLSRPEGATGQDSLFLDYPYAFIAMVPFVAARKRHWATCLAGITMVLIAWAITPLQSAVFSTMSFTLRHGVQLYYPFKIADLRSQNFAMHLSVFTAQYDVAWLNGSYDPYMTSEYFLAPIWVAGDERRDPYTECTGSTTKYWAELECEEAGVWVPEDYDNGKKVAYDNDFGCEALHLEFLGDGYALAHIGYARNDQEWSMESFECPRRWSNHTLTVLAGPPKNGSQVERDVTATLCTPRYYKQEVTATMSESWPGSFTTPMNETVQAILPQEPISPSEFNMPAFESFLLTSGNDRPEFGTVSDVTNATRVQGKNITESFGVFVDPIVGMWDHPVDAYRDPALLADAVNNAYRSMFAIVMGAVHSVPTNISAGEGELSGRRYGVVVSRGFSASVEAALCVAATLTILLAWVCQRSPIMLSSDPGSISSLMKMIHGSPEVAEMYSGKGSLSTEALSAELGQKRFQLICGCRDPSQRTCIRVIDDHASQCVKKDLNDQEARQKLTGRASYKPVTPLPFNLMIGIGIASALMAALCVLAVLKKKEQNLGGLLHPSDNEDIDSFVTDLLPTALATLIEPFLVLLNRLLCALQPFNDLRSSRRARRVAGGSLKTRYTAVPPQLTIFDAARSGHFYLASMCTIALLVNLLAISLSGLFYNRMVVSSEPVALPPLKESFLRQDTQTTVDDGYETLMRYATETRLIITQNKVRSTRRLPWTTEEFVLMPLGSPMHGDWSKYDLTSTTIGVGVDLSCRAVGPIDSMINDPPILDLSSDVTADYLEECSKTYQAWQLRFNGSEAYPDGPLPVNEFRSMDAPIDQIGSKCFEPFVVSWSRTDMINETMIVSSSFVVCNPTIKSATFEIDFNTLGEIQDARRTGDLDVWNPTSVLMRNETILSKLNTPMFTNPGIWPMPSHNGTASWEMFHVLMFAEMNHQVGIWDVNATVPDPGDMVPIVEKTYKHIFATSMGLRLDEFEEATDKAPIEGNAYIFQSRLFMSDPSVILSLTILALQVIVLAVLYTRAFQTFLPRLPTSIGSLTAYVAASSIVRDYETHGIDHTRMLGFGTFIDNSGREQVGIDYAENIIPEDPDKVEEPSHILVEDGNKFGRR